MEGHLILQKKDWKHYDLSLCLSLSLSVSEQYIWKL